MRTISYRVVVVFSVLALAFAFLHWCLSFKAIPGERVKFSAVNDIAWNPIAKTMVRVGNDPFVILDLPAAAIPIRSASFVFIGAHVPAEGTYFIFQSHAEHPLTPSIESTAGSFTVSAKLDDSSSLRLDLPDFLPRTIEFRRLVIQTPLVAVKSVSFWLTLGSLSAAGGGLLLLVIQRIRNRTLPV